MATANTMFLTECQDNTLVITPTTNLGELADHQIELEEAALLRELADTPTQNLVLDFHRTDYFGSSALGFFLRLWKLVQGRNGRMAICNVSEHEREILKVCELDGLWAYYPSRAEALKAVSGQERVQPRRVWPCTTGADRTSEHLP